MTREATGAYPPVDESSADDVAGAEVVTAPKSWPCGPYSVIVADPPWMYQKNPGAKGGAWGDAFLGTAEHAYPTMTNEDLAALPVRDLAAKDAHLFMWVTNPGMFGGRFSKITPAEIAEAWGFRYVTLLTWVKTKNDGDPLLGGMGWYFRGCTEHVLYAVRGKAAIHKDIREPNLISAPRGRHSAKPDAFMQMVERVTDGPRLELFARQQRPGWDAWGNEVAPSAPDLFSEGVA